MSDTDYEAILDKGWDEIPTVIDLPDGHYRLQGSGASYKAPAQADGKPIVNFVDRILEAEADVEGLPADYDVKSNKIFTKFWISDANDWDRVRKHLTQRGVDLKGKSIKEALAAYKGTEAMGYVKTRVFERKDGTIGKENYVSSWMPV